MDKSVTLSVKGLLVTGLVLLGLAVAYLLGDSGRAADASPAPAPAAAEPEAERTLTMAGTGEATAVPDQLGFTLRVRTTRPDLGAALGAGNDTVRKVLARLAELGIEKSDVQTTGLSMNPVYDYHQYGPRTLRGYRVSQTSRVLVSELKKGGAAISAAVAAGGNGVRTDDIRLIVADPDAVLAEAREAAVEQATAKAQEYAAATGQQLGEVLTLREVTPGADRSSDPYEQLAMARGYSGDLAMANAYSAMPIRAGEQDLSVRVEVVWRLAE